MKNYLLEVEIPLSYGIEKIISELTTIGFEIDFNFQPKRLKINVDQSTQNIFLIKIQGKDNDIEKCNVIPYIKNYWLQYDIIPFSKTD